MNMELGRRSFSYCWHIQRCPGNARSVPHFPRVHFWPCIFQSCIFIRAFFIPTFFIPALSVHPARASDSRFLRHCASL